jgi:hypothetical protein
MPPLFPGISFRVLLQDPGLGSLLPEGFADMDGGLPAGAREALENALEAPSVQHPADPLEDELLSPSERRQVARSRVSGRAQGVNSGDIA